MRSLNAHKRSFTPRPGALACEDSLYSHPVCGCRSCSRAREMSPLLYHLFALHTPVSFPHRAMRDAIPSATVSSKEPCCRSTSLRCIVVMYRAAVRQHRIVTLRVRSTSLPSQFSHSIINLNPSSSAVPWNRRGTHRSCVHIRHWSVMRSRASASDRCSTAQMRAALAPIAQGPNPLVLLHPKPTSQLVVAVAPTQAAPASNGRARRGAGGVVSHMPKPVDHVHQSSL